MVVFKAIMAKGKGRFALRALRKVRKDLKIKKNGNGNGRGLPMSKRNATIVLAQGAMAAPKKNWGGGQPAGKSIAAMVACLDARIPRTLGLPRAVGPYTVVRTTSLHESAASFVMFCPFYNEVDNKWYDWCGVEGVSAALGVSATNNTRPINMPMLGLADACEVVPAALTVQVMNPNALQSAHGVFAMARVNQQLQFGGSAAALTWNEVAARVISFYSPRLLTGGKLCLRGVKGNSYPLDMSEYAKFAPIGEHAGLFTWGNATRPAALAPIVFVQENATNAHLQFMVTIEWRVRFDPGNPATSSHTFHDTLAYSDWNRIIKSASSAGHGIEELSEDVAIAGSMAYTAGSYLAPAAVAV